MMIVWEDWHAHAPGSEMCGNLAAGGRGLANWQWSVLVGLCARLTDGGGPVVMVGAGC